MVSASFADNVEECLEYSLIQQDEPPVDLFVNLTADPCPEITWYLNDAVLTDLSYYNPNDTVVSGTCIEQYEITMYFSVHVGSSPTQGSSFFFGKVTALGVLCCFVCLFDLT